MVIRSGFRKRGDFDAIGRGILKDIRDLPVKGVSDVRFGLYITLNGNINQTQAKRIAEELLINKITQEYSLDARTDEGD